jgi:hypothetical protein
MLLVAMAARQCVGSSAIFINRFLFISLIMIPFIGLLFGDDKDAKMELESSAREASNERKSAIPR